VSTWATRTSFFEERAELFLALRREREERRLA
jgi:hypothetical protein